MAMCKIPSSTGADVVQQRERKAGEMAKGGERKNRVVGFFFTSTSIITADPNETRTFLTVCEVSRDAYLKNATAELPRSFRGFLFSRFFLFVVGRERKEIIEKRVYRANAKVLSLRVHISRGVNFEYYSAQRAAFPGKTFIFGISILGSFPCVADVCACALEKKRKISRGQSDGERSGAHATSPHINVLISADFGYTYTRARVGTRVYVCVCICFCVCVCMSIRACTQGTFVPLTIPSTTDYRQLQSGE